MFPSLVRRIRDATKVTPPRCGRPLQDLRIRSVLPRAPPPFPPPYHDAAAIRFAARPTRQPALVRLRPPRRTTSHTAPPRAADSSCGYVQIGGKTPRWAATGLGMDARPRLWLAALMRRIYSVLVPCCRYILGILT